MAGWLSRLFGGGGTEVGGPVKAPAPVVSAPPRAVTPLPREPVVVPEREDNPVHALLDACGVPWRETRGDLETRFGVTQTPFYGWDQLALPASGPLADGALVPLWAQVGGFSPRMPPVYLSATLWSSDDARENVRRVAAALAPWLGETVVEDTDNTVYCDWRFGPAMVSLTGWPTDLQQGDAYEVDAHRLEPRLEAACHVAIDTGFRPGLTARERAWLDGFSSIAAIPGADRLGAGQIADTPAAENELEFVRQPPKDVERFVGQVGLSADGAALIFCDRQLYVAPVWDIVDFDVVRTLPAKGGGGSQLVVNVRVTDEDVTGLWIATAQGPDDLTGMGEALAAATGRPVRIGDYGYDA